MFASVAASFIEFKVQEKGVQREYTPVLHHQSRYGPRVPRLLYAVSAAASPFLPPRCRPRYSHSQRLLELQLLRGLWGQEPAPRPSALRVLVPRGVRPVHEHCSQGLGVRLEERRRVRVRARVRMRVQAQGSPRQRARGWA